MSSIKTQQDHEYSIPLFSFIERKIGIEPLTFGLDDIVVNLSLLIIPLIK